MTDLNYVRLKKGISVLLIYLFVPLCLCVSVPLSAEEMPADSKITNSIGMDFVRIEPGSFQMGHAGALPEDIADGREHGGRATRLPPDGDFDERPVHTVKISSAYYMGATEVTNRQYELFDPLHAHLRGKYGFSIDHDEAVVFVGWNEAVAFCRWLSEKEGLPYRLATEAEWEYACRAGTTTVYSTGDSPAEEFIKNPDNSWYPVVARSRGRQEVVPLHVAKTQPNPWGLYDMHGNVEEWVLDWYGPYQACDQADPVGPVDGDFRVCRGGSHGTIPYYLRSANRMGTLPEDKSWYTGFRVVIGPMPDSTPIEQPPVSRCSMDVKTQVPAGMMEGPDSERPYFEGPRNYVKIPDGSMGPLFSRHNHDPAIVDCPNGDLMAIWYSGLGERGRELSVAASRLRYGASEWEPASVFWDAPDRNDHAPAMYFDGDRTIYHFNGLAAAATWGPLAVVMRTSIDSGATWSRASLIMPEHRGRQQVIESVFRTREGFMILPCDATPSGSGGTALHISRDGGHTWADAGGTIAGIHAAAVQLDDGRLMAMGRGDEVSENRPWMATSIRRLAGVPEKSMTKSLSTDMGKTWTYQPTIFPPVGGGQRLVLLKLSEGPLFLASFASEDQIPVMVTDQTGTNRRVIGLYTAVSFDDGQTWPHIRLVSDDGLDREVGTTNGRPFTLGLSSAEPKGYMSVCQGRNGVIHLITSWNHYAFNLKWLTSRPAEATRK